MTADATTIAGVILAGGQARRFDGRDKAFVSLAGRPLIAHAIARLRPQVGALAISANGDPARFAEFRLPVLPDTVPGFAGPLAGILAGMEWARRIGAERLATVAVDTPFFPSDLVARLAGAAGTSTISVASSGGRRHPVFGLFPVTLADDLAAFVGRGETLKAADWLDRHATTAVAFGPLAGAPEPFFNINSEADAAAVETVRLARPLHGERK